MAYSKKPGFMIAFLAVFLGFGLSPAPTNALSGSEFNAGRIIDDAVFYDSSSIDVQTIQRFLENKVPACDTNGTQSYAGTTRAAYGTAHGYPPPYTCLRNYTQDTPTKVAETGLCNQYNGGAKIASQIILDVAQACGINPKVLVVLLQKEQNLVTDDWPWSIQYRSATGYGCPDTAACDSTYYGFFNQVYSAARQFKRYGRDTTSYSYRAGRSNYIQYNPSTSCGGSSIYIENQATANLYNYTPYQPNVAALNNLYGTGDSCSAYGNRNFWRIFNDWFGSVYITGPYIAVSSDPNENKLWLINGAQKYWITSPDILSAWNLSSRKIYTVDKTYLGALTEMHPLTRLFQDGSTGIAYFVDRGTYYRITDPDQVTLWNFNWGDVAPFGDDNAARTFMSYGGNLAYSFVPENVNSIFMVDGTTIRRYLSPQVLDVLGSPVMQLSANYFNQYFASHEGSTLSSSVLTDGTTKLFMDKGGAYNLSSSMAPLYPSGNTVTPETLRRITKYNQDISFFLQDPANSKVYLIDGGQKRWITNPQVLFSLTSNTRTITSKVGVGLLPEGAAITNAYLHDASGNYYLINNGQTHKIDATGINEWQPYVAGAAQVTDSLINTLSPLGEVFTTKVLLDGKTALVRSGAAYASSNVSLLGLWGETNATTPVSLSFVNSVYTKPLSSYVKSSDPNDGRIFLVTAAGSLVHIIDFNSYLNSLNANPAVVTLAPNAITSMNPVSKSFAAVKSSSKMYAFDNGKLREISSSAFADWDGSSISVDQNFLNIQSYAPPLASQVLNGTDGKIYYVQNGQKRWISSYATFKNSYASQGVASVSQSLINALPSGPNIP